MDLKAIMKERVLSKLSYNTLEADVRGSCLVGSWGQSCGGFERTTNRGSGCERTKQVCRKGMTLPTPQAALVITGHLNVSSLIGDYLSCLWRGEGATQIYQKSLN